MKTRHIVALSIISDLLVASAGASIYTVYREDIDKVIFPSYSTIVPTDDPRRNSTGAQGACNDGFSPNPCVGTIPEPSSYALFGLGLGILIWRVRRERHENQF